MPITGFFRLKNESGSAVVINSFKNIDLENKAINYDPDLPVSFASSEQYRFI
jgi:hypothetical protein